MAAQTAAQEEFNNIVSKAAGADSPSEHPDDHKDYAHDRENSDIDDETADAQHRIDQAMRMPSSSGAGGMLHLPPREFDQGRTTGVKGVIADARSFQEARHGVGSSWFGRSNSVRGAENSNGSGGNIMKRASRMSMIKKKDEDVEADAAGSSSLSDDEGFLERWREQRRAELQQKGNDIRTRRTSPSVRRYGRFDEVDALGYLDAIEKVGRDTVVVVFVYDSDCAVSQVISDALQPLVPKYPIVHFVRVPYDVIEFDNAGVPAILAYKNQGDLFANLTYIIDQIPEDIPFDTKVLESVLQKHQVL